LPKQTAAGASAGGGVGKTLNALLQKNIASVKLFLYFETSIYRTLFRLFYRLFGESATGLADQLTNSGRAFSYSKKYI
jgi:hypothetical protein